MEQFRHSLEGSDGFAIDSIEEIPRRGDRCRVQYQCDPRLIIQITSPLYGILDHARFVPRFTPRLFGSLSNSSSNQRDVYSACPSVVFEEIFIVTFAQQLTRETDSRFQDSGVFRRLLPRYVSMEFRVAKTRARFIGIVPLCRSLGFTPGCIYSKRAPTEIDSLATAARDHAEESSFQLHHRTLSSFGHVASVARK